MNDELGEALRGRSSPSNLFARCCCGGSSRNIIFYISGNPRLAIKRLRPGSCIPSLCQHHQTVILRAGIDGIRRKQWRLRAGERAKHLFGAERENQHLCRK